MASETLIRRTCDRCKKVIQETPASAPNGIEKVPPALFMEVRRIQPEPAIAAKGETIAFDDLCVKCCGRLLDLFDQVRLTKADGDDKPDKSSETLDVASKPKDNKGSKPAEAKPA